MSNIAIQVENLSKAYQLGEIGTGTISHDLERWWAKLRGKEDPFLKIGQTNDRTTKAEKNDIVWSLKDINFEINQGDAVGIIGRNGAGKSTLLKILSRVTSPTTGSIKLKGRVASLLEVGTGFHPELSGRENIFLNGAILGMRKSEIIRKFDDIVAFAGVERYIDTPVKRYSSGMYVRLAFAVAAHLESEILIVDEVLAVGDAEFQKKCLGKMNDVSKNEGRTVLFVSHNMQAVKSLCTNGILLTDGTLFYEGTTEKCISNYLNFQNINYDINTINEFILNQNDDIFYLRKVFLQQESTSDINYHTNRKIFITIEYEVLKDILGLRIGFDLIDVVTGVVIFRSFSDDVEKNITILKKGNYKISVAIPENFLKSGSFGIKLAIGIHSVRWIVYDDNLTLKFNIINVDGLNSVFSDTRPGFIMPQLDWQNTNIQN